MDTKRALKAFDALSQETRLRAFRYLAEAGRDGLAAGRLAEKLRVPHNTLSFHLTNLSQAGLVTSKRKGRSIIYHARLDKVHALTQFMVDKVCVVDFMTIEKAPVAVTEEDIVENIEAEIEVVDIEAEVDEVYEVINEDKDTPHTKTLENAVKKASEEMLKKSKPIISTVVLPKESKVTTTVTMDTPTKDKVKTESKKETKKTKAKKTGTTDTEEQLFMF